MAKSNLCPSQDGLLAVVGFLLVGALGPGFLRGQGSVILSDYQKKGGMQVRGFAFQNICIFFEFDMIFCAHLPSQFFRSRMEAGCLLCWRRPPPPRESSQPAAFPSQQWVSEVENLAKMKDMG